MVLRPAILTFVLVFFTLFALDEKTRAATEPAAAARDQVLELVVFEHQDCTYCRVFRDATLPRYRASGQDKKAPLRFVRIEDTDTSQLNLSSEITMVPTAVLMQDGQEIGRIAGYWAPDAFFKMLAHMMPPSAD